MNSAANIGQDGYGKPTVEIELRLVSQSEENQIKYHSLYEYEYV